MVYGDKKAAWCQPSEGSQCLLLSEKAGSAFLSSDNNRAEVEKATCIWEARAAGFHRTSRDLEIQVQYSVQELVKFSRMTNLLLEYVSPTTLGILHMKCYS